MNRRTFLRGVVATAITSASKPLWACMEECTLTEEDIEGPYFLPNAPERATLIETGMEGQALELGGVLKDQFCNPIANAAIEFWQCDARGRYDTRGMRLRGRLHTDSAGRYALRTIVPGRYLNGSRYRPSHLHVKAHGGVSVLTTQLYFAGDPYNTGDPWFSARRMLSLQEDHGGFRSQFDFVVRAAQR